MDFSPNIDQESDKMYWRKHFNKQLETFSEPAKILDFRNPKLMKQIHESIVDSIDIDGGKVLDAGCGLGELEILLDSIMGPLKDFEFYCIDIAEKVLMKCRDRLAKISYLQIEFFLMDITNLVFKEAMFDLCISSEALQYVDPIIGLRELLRVTKKGGEIILSVPNRLHPVIKNAEIRNAGMYRGIDVKEVQELLKGKCRKIYVRPLIFAQDQSNKPYIENELKDITLLSDAEIRIANRFIIKVEV